MATETYLLGILGLFAIPDPTSSFVLDFMAKTTTAKSPTVKNTSPVQISTTQRIAATSVTSSPLCVCTKHNYIHIYERPDAGSPPVGNMYEDDCKLYGNQSTPKFLSVLHYQTIAYVTRDYSTALGPCPVDFIPEIFDVVSTTVRSQSHERCNKVMVFMSIAKSQNVGSSKASLCTDGLHHTSKASVETFCPTSTATTWLQGLQVLAYCSRIPMFSPVGVFNLQTDQYQTGAGILLECNSQSLTIVTQNCTSSLNIVNVTNTDYPSSIAYHVIEWM